ncbi:MAG: hypothetical protein ACYTGZ_20860 [Planctomycetota bacterium]
MARLIHVERAQVKSACAKFEKLLAKDPDARREMRERAKQEKAEKKRRDKEFAATQPKPKKRKKSKKKKAMR